MEIAVEQNRRVGLIVDCVLIRRDGFESAIEDSAAPIHDRAGRVIGAVIVFHDVSAARAMSAPNDALRAARFSHEFAQSRCCSTTGSPRRLPWLAARTVRSP